MGNSARTALTRGDLARASHYAEEDSGSGRGFGGKANVGGTFLACKHEFEACHFDPIPAPLLGMIERLIRLAQKLRDVEGLIAIDGNADAHGCPNGMAVHIGSGFRKGGADAFGDRQRPFPRRIVKHDREFLPAQSSDHTAAA